ncbi:MAG TPA: hypothetical protein VMG10_01725 [Gemmataceae bacterium]|nr:hypothetical protein [Gemmataceae bacterium]
MNMADIREELLSSLHTESVAPQQQTLGYYQAGFTTIDSFLRGVGSVLEFFPPLERFDIWRVAPDVPIEEWPMAVRGLLAELQEDASKAEDHS